ncbi:MAG: hypothetical protein ACRDOJ_01915, partial [Nocardioidaceae bacterium]
SESAFIEALERLPGSYDAVSIREHARKFSPETFQSTISERVGRLTSSTIRGAGRSDAQLSTSQEHS